MRKGNENCTDENAFSQCSDEELILRLQQEANPKITDFIIQKYTNLVRARAKSYYLKGADRDDLFQEGLIGLYKAIRDFRSDKQASFSGFADLCVKRQIITAVKTANRQKHSPLNSYVSFNKPISDDRAERSFEEIYTHSTIMNPEDLFIGKENFRSLEAALKKHLSYFEWRVFLSYYEGKSYQEIAQDLDRPLKSIDNALQRVKRKIEKHLDVDKNYFRNQRKDV